MFAFSESDFYTGVRRRNVHEKLVSIGLSTKGIANTLNATESLVEEILDSLDRKKYAHKEAGKAWALTEDGEKYLKGIIEDRESENAQYGFMFVNTIKKEVLPYFLSGDLNRVPLYRGASLPEKLTVEGDEARTFEEYIPKRTKLREASASVDMNGLQVLKADIPEKVAPIVLE